MKIGNKTRCVMIDNNEDCVTKSNLQKQETHLPNIMIGAG